MMGITQLETNNTWNTMPAHIHDRRMEVYLYLDIEEDARVFHFMGSHLKQDISLWLMRKRLFLLLGPFIQAQAQRIIHLFGQWLARTIRSKIWTLSQWTS